MSINTQRLRDAHQQTRDGLDLLNAEIMRCTDLPTRLRLIEVKKKLLAADGNLLLAGSEAVAA